MQSYWLSLSVWVPIVAGMIVLAAGRVVFERRSGEGAAETLERAVLAAGDGAA